MHPLPFCPLAPEGIRRAAHAAHPSQHQATRPHHCRSLLAGSHRLSVKATGVWAGKGGMWRQSDLTDGLGDKRAGPRAAAPGLRCAHPVPPSPRPHRSNSRNAGTEARAGATAHAGKGSPGPAPGREAPPQRPALTPSSRRPLRRQKRCSAPAARVQTATAPRVLPRRARPPTTPRPPAGPPPQPRSGEATRRSQAAPHGTAGLTPGPQDSRPRRVPAARRKREFLKLGRVKPRGAPT